MKSHLFDCLQQQLVRMTRQHLSPWLRLLQPRRCCPVPQSFRPPAPPPPPGPPSHPQLPALWRAQAALSVWSAWRLRYVFYCDVHPATVSVQTMKTLDCLSVQAQIIFLPCGHVCCCQVCSGAVQGCPLCRSNILQRVRLYHS